MAKRHEAFVVRLVAWWLWLYPRAFRQRFGASMRADLADGWARCSTSSERIGFVARAVADTFTAALAERFADGRNAPAIAPPGDAKGAAGLVDRWLYDVRLAVRRGARHPTTAAVSVVTLAVGLGLAAAVYALVDGVLLRPLPYADPERLVRIWSVGPDGTARFLDATADELRAFRDVPAFSAVGAYSLAPRDLSDDAGRPMGITMLRISEGLFDVLGVEPTLGRRFTATELAEGRPVVLLTERFWRSRYASDPEILDQTLAIQGEPHQIVGVLPAGLDIDNEAALWRPFTTEENQDDDRELILVARLGGPSEVADALALANAQLAVAAATTSSAAADGGPGHGAWVQPLHATWVRDVRAPLWTLLAAVGLLLALACSNVAHLQLSQLATRRREMAVRTALGADRGRLSRQLVVESLVLAGAAGFLGLWIGRAVLDLFLRLAPADLPRSAEITLDLRVVAVMAMVTAGAGMVAGWLPARRSATIPPAEALGGRHELASIRRSQGWLVTVEVALATVLAATAGLLFSSLGARLDVDHGLDLDHTLHLALSPPPSADEGEQREAFYRRVVGTVATLPSVEAVGIGSFQPLEPRGFAMPFEWLDASSTESSERRAITWAIDPGWLDAADVALLAGRGFDPAIDGEEGVAIVDRAFVREHLGVDEPAAALGLRLRHRAYWGDGRASEHRIIGVVANVRADAAAAPRSRLYLPYRHFPWPRMKLLVRTAGDPAMGIETLRARIWSLDPSIALDRAMPLRALVEARVADQRFQVRLLGSFAHLALLLAAVGFYAVLSATVAARTRELAVRRALGAGRREIARSVLRRAFAWVLPGLGLGLLGARGVGEVLARRLHGVEAFEPGLWTAVVATLIAVTLIACAAPLRRALRVDPMIVLKA